MSESEKRPLPARVTTHAQAFGMAATPADALAALNNVVEAGREYFRLREENTKARARLDSYRMLESEKIRAAERVLTDYFDLVFKERSENFRGLWSRLEAAAELGDDHAVRTVLGGIVQLAQISPLSGLADLQALRSAFDDPNQVWEL